MCNQISIILRLSLHEATVKYHILWSISTGTSIRRLRIFAVPTARGTYNHGVLFIEVKNTVVGLFLQMSTLLMMNRSA